MSLVFLCMAENLLLTEVFVYGSGVCTVDPSLPTAQSPLLQQAVLLAQEEAQAKHEPLQLVSFSMFCVFATCLLERLV